MPARTNQTDYANQQTLVAALRERNRFPHAAQSVQLVETHISWVLLAGRYAYKIKKALDLGFLNFTSLEAREFYCSKRSGSTAAWRPGFISMLSPSVGIRLHRNSVLNRPSNTPSGCGVLQPQNSWITCWRARRLCRNIWTSLPPCWQFFMVACLMLTQTRYWVRQRQFVLRPCKISKLLLLLLTAQADQDAVAELGRSNTG